MSGGRVLLGVCTLVALGAPSPAAALPRLHHHRIVSSVRLVQDGAGTLISVTYEGRRPHTRMLRVEAAVDAVAIRPLGRRLGIFAATAEGRLLLWKESRGRTFVQAPPPPRTLPLSRGAGLRPTRGDDGPAQLGDMRDTADVPYVSRPAQHTMSIARVSCGAASIASSPIGPAPGRAPPRAA